MSSHEIYFCRALYKDLREKGAPAVHIHEFGGVMCAETSDGELLIEDVKNACCKWAVKFDVASIWMERKPRNHTEPT